MDTIFQFIFDLVLQYVGQSIRWLFFLGKTKFSDLEDSAYNYILSILFFVLIGYVFSKIES